MAGWHSYGFAHLTCSTLRCATAIAGQVPFFAGSAPPNIIQAPIACCSPCFLHHLHVNPGPQSQSQQQSSQACPAFQPNQH